jgi:hypothetical protein
MLRHYKTMPFVPSFMQEEASKVGAWSFAAPNPFEADTQKYLCYRNTVFVRADMSPEALQAVELQIKAEEAEDAIRRSAAQVQAGEAALGEQKRPEGDQPPASDSDHAEREAEGGGGPARVQATSHEAKAATAKASAQADGFSD